MNKLFIVAIAVFSLSSAYAEDTPRQAAEKARDQEMAKAQAEKVRNDKAVDKQRSMEKGKSDADKADKADKKARTG